MKVPHLYRELRPASTSNCCAAKNEILRRVETAGSGGLSWRNCRDAETIIASPTRHEGACGNGSSRTELARNDPSAYVAHLLFSRLGLRNIEIVNARTHWINDGSIGIINRPEEDFFPKGCEGWVPIAPDVLKEVLSFQPLASNGYLVPGANRTERHDAVYRRHSKWVSQWIKDRTKTSYELRRYAGSRLLDLGATIFEVRDFLRHRDVQTTQMWYAYRLQNRQLRTIGMRDLLPP